MTEALTKDAQDRVYLSNAAGAATSQESSQEVVLGA